MKRSVGFDVRVWTSDPFTDQGILTQRSTPLDMFYSIQYLLWRIYKKEDYFVTNWLEFDTHESGYSIMKLSGGVLALIFICVAQVRTFLTFIDINEICLIES